MSTLLDQQLLALAQRGDGEAFAVLYDRYRSRVFYQARRLSVHLAQVDDVVGTVFLEVWRLRDRVRIVDGSMLPWILALTTNVVRNSNRTLHRYRKFIAALPPETSPDAALIAEANVRNDELGSVLRDALNGLSDVDQGLLVLTVLEGLSIASAAQAVGVSTPAAKVRLSRMRRRLAARLQTVMPEIREVVQ